MENEIAKFERATDPNDKRRCKGASAGGDGQCPFLGMKNPRTGEYADNCARHSGGLQVKKQNREETNLYNLTTYQQRILQFQQHPQAKTLTAELALLRIMLETKLQRFSDPADLMIASGGISDLIMKVHALVKTIQNFDKNNGQMIHKSEVEALANRFVSIIAAYVEDTEVLESIAVDMGKAMDESSSNQISRNYSSGNSKKDD